MIPVKPRIGTGARQTLQLVERLLDGEALELPALAAKIMIALAGQVRDPQARLRGLDKDLMAWFRGSEVARRPETIPGIGVIMASALAATVTDPHQFTSGRQFAAWLGLTPRAHSSGGKERQGRISKMGDRYLRRLLINGMTPQLQSVRRHPDVHPWTTGLLHRKPAKLVAVAMANKAARTAWVIMTRGDVYRAPQPANQEAAA